MGVLGGFICGGIWGTKWLFFNMYNPIFRSLYHMRTKRRFLKGNFCKISWKVHTKKKHPVVVAIQWVVGEKILKGLHSQGCWKKVRIDFSLNVNREDNLGRFLHHSSPNSTWFTPMYAPSFLTIGLSSCYFCLKWKCRMNLHSRGNMFRCSLWMSCISQLSPFLGITTNPEGKYRVDYHFANKEM